jgi:5-methylcytosine-specific restriction endonuclease McrA
MLLGSVLVLNATYEPIHVCRVRRAVTLLMKGVAVCEEYTGHVLTSPSTSIQCPDVIRLKRFVRIPLRQKSFSRTQVFVRDEYVCQYCGKTFGSAELTLDHVLPRSRNGKSSWENVVTSCKKCNERKADRSPEEAGMFPLRKPRAPAYPHYYFHVRGSSGHRESWRKYFYI